MDRTFYPRGALEVFVEHETVSADLRAMAAEILGVRSTGGVRVCDTGATLPLGGGDLTVPPGGILGAPTGVVRVRHERDPERDQ